MAKKRTRASWWKMFANQRAVIEAAPDADVGSGLKAAFAYFDGEEVDISGLTSSAYMVFCSMKTYLDEAISDYEESVKNGQKGAGERWNR